MSKNQLLYPIKFTPILKEKIWGGQKLKKLLHKKSNLKKLGESWELSGVEGNISVVSNGAFKGETLTNLIQTYKNAFVGEAVYQKFGNTFPLMFKFIDAAEDLSIQVHPNDELAKKRNQPFGKTEMWYVLNANKNSKLYVGFNNKFNKEAYLKKFNEGEISEIINTVKVQKGATFLIESGTVHAIGKGILLAEIHQTSDITYRIFDWNRVDSNGNSRELHTDLALDAIDFSKTKIDAVSYKNVLNQSEELVYCNYFNTNKLIVDGAISKDLSKIDSFVVFMCVGGRGFIAVENNKESIKIGEIILIPASINSIEISSTEEKLELLEVYIDLK